MTKQAALWGGARLSMHESIDMQIANLNDAGPWGQVWPWLIDRTRAESVARVLHGWRAQDIRDLWSRLSAVVKIAPRFILQPNV